jgi:hypothetical protein
MHKLDLIQHKLAHFSIIALWCRFHVRQREKNPAHIGPFCAVLPVLAWGAVANISVKKTSPVPNTWKWLVE